LSRVRIARSGGGAVSYDRHGAEHVLARRRIAEPLADARHVREVDVLLVHDQSVQLDPADVDRHRVEGVAQERLRQTARAQRFELVRQRQHRDAVGRARLVPGAARPLVTHRSPLVRQRARFRTLTVDRYVVHERDELAQRRAAEQEHVVVDGRARVRRAQHRNACRERGARRPWARLSPP
jgi:hypothetical protein